jgi:putative ABC transport system substrate-binding protein
LIAAEYDPLEVGFVKNLARPGGNVTGVFLQQIEIASKRLQFLKDALPNFHVATMFWDSISGYQWRSASKAAAAFGLRLAGVELQKAPYDYEEALASAPADGRNTLILPIAPVFYRDRERLAAFGIEHRIASMSAVREFAVAGGLMSYGPDFPAMFRLVAEYVDRIAKGAKTADMPVEQPIKFELVINRKTAKLIGFDIPNQLLVLADEVIE